MKRNRKMLALAAATMLTVSSKGITPTSHPQQNSTIICAVKILKNMLKG